MQVQEQACDRLAASVWLEVACKLLGLYARWSDALSEKIRRS